MHVESIVLASVGAGGPNNKGQATVTIVDAFGAPVEGATVTGTFTGDVGGTIGGVTDASGVAVLESPGKAKGAIVFTFCVDDVAKSGWTYDGGANVETCDSFSAS